MAKAKKDTGKIIMLVAALLGLVAILMMFAPGISWKTASILGKSKSGSYSGFKIAFGGSVPVIEGVASFELKFNVMAFLAIVFTLAGLVCSLLACVFKGKILKYVSVIAFVLSAIFFFIFRAVFPMGIENGKDVIDGLEKIGMTFSLGAGAIVAGILSILAALASAVAAFAVK